MERDVAGGEGFCGFGADAEVGVGFGVENLAVFADDVGGGQGKTPALVTIDEGEVDEDGEVIVAVVFGDAVDEPEFFCDGILRIGEDGEGQAVLADHEIALAFGLRCNRHEESAVLAEFAVEVAPGFEFGDAVGAPAAAEELEDQRAEGEEIAGADELAC